MKYNKYFFVFGKKPKKSGDIFICLFFDLGLPLLNILGGVTAHFLKVLLHTPPIVTPHTPYCYSTHPPLLLHTLLRYSTSKGGVTPHFVIYFAQGSSRFT